MTQLVLFPKATKNTPTRGARFSRLVESVWSLVSGLAKAWRWTWNRAVPSAPKKRSATKGMLLDVLESAWTVLMGGGRLVSKHWYCERLARGTPDARQRRWSTFRASLRTYGIAHKQAPDGVAGVVLLDPLAAYQQAESLLPRIVGLPSEREEEQHEAAAMDFGVFARLGVARVGGWQAVSSGAGRTL